MSSRETVSLSCGQTYCCFNRVLHFLCSQLNVTAADDSVAEKSFTGIETKPNETVAEPIARAGMNLSVSIAGNVGQTGEKRRQSAAREPRPSRRDRPAGPRRRRQADARRDSGAAVLGEGLVVRAEVRRLPLARGPRERRAEARLSPRRRRDRDVSRNGSRASRAALRVARDGRRARRARRERPAELSALAEPLAAPPRDRRRACRRRDAGDALPLRSTRARGSRPPRATVGRAQAGALER